MQASIHTFEDADGSGSALLDDGTLVTYAGEVFGASGLRHLRTGQRVSIDLADDGRTVTRLWVVGIGPGERVG